MLKQCKGGYIIDCIASILKGDKSKLDKLAHSGIFLVPKPCPSCMHRSH